MSEAAVSARVRLKASKLGLKLFKNVRGFFWTLDKERKVMAGLQLDDSADLIGWVPMVITESMVGKTLPIFSHVEVKKEGWKRPKNEHERKQVRLCERLKKQKVFACIVDSEELLEKELEYYKNSC